jgi:dipeptidyl aminopeptidase/acylaminoacyl peptidase
MINIERLLRIPHIDPEGSFDISPDGTRLAFAWNLTGQWEIYELDLNASNEPRPVSSPKMVSVGPGGKFAPKYSPDGSRLAYAVDFDGGENFHIFIQQCHAERSKASPDNAKETLRSPALHQTQCGASVAQGDNLEKLLDLTPDIDFAIQPNFCWSPDGTQIVFLADQSGCFDTYVMPASGGNIRLLFANGFPAWTVRWSPDGRHLAVMSEGAGQDYGVYVIPLDGGQTFPITDERGQINAHNPAWSPDGTKLAFHSDTPNGFHQIGIFDLNSRRISWLTNGEANCRAPAWSKDGAQLTYIRAQGASDKVVVHPLGGAAQEFRVDTGVHYKPRFTSDGKHVIFAFNNPRHPPDLWKLTPESGEFHQITNSLRSSDFAKHPTEFVMPQEITYPGLDGTPIPALLFEPDGANENTSAVVVIHGGPSWHFQVEWHPFMIHLASRGWTVIAPNYRGSTGYGREWQLSNRFNLGGVDTDDVAASVSYLLDKGIANPRRIAVTGRSHGGYLTMSCLTRYPELWRAGSAVVPFLNWFSAHENSREDLQHWDLQNFGNPKDNYDLWYERSPFFFLDRVQAPVQLICGENDPRCPASESAQARDKLLEHGKEVDFHLYPGEGHAFLKTENVVDAEVRRVEFLAKALE